MPVLSTLLYLSALAAAAIAGATAALSRLQFRSAMLSGFLPVAGLAGLWLLLIALRTTAHGPFPADSEGGSYTLGWSVGFTFWWLVHAAVASLLGALAGRSVRAVALRLTGRDRSA